MENKYFTPDIEDLHIGYELKVNYNFKLNDIFHKIIIDSFEELSDIHSRMSGDCVIRVPYLTKEQIEAEGWKHTGGKLLSFAEQHYVKSTYRVSYSIDSKKIKFFIADPDEIINYEDECIFNGQCKDINTFRKIIKLLGI